jgi:hypothetical protein
VKNKVTEDNVHGNAGRYKTIETILAIIPLMLIINNITNLAKEL